MDVLARIVQIIFSAAVGEGIIEFLLSPVVGLWLAEERRTERTVIFNYASAALGVAIAFGFGLGIFEALGATETLVGMDRALTGIIIGRGANWVHGLASKYFGGLRSELDTIK